MLVGITQSTLLRLLWDTHVTAHHNAGLVGLSARFLQPFGFGAFQLLALVGVQDGAREREAAVHAVNLFLLATCHSTHLGAARDHLFLCFAALHTLVQRLNFGFEVVATATLFCGQFAAFFVGSFNQGHVLFVVLGAETLHVVNRHGLKMCVFAFAFLCILGRLRSFRGFGYLFGFRLQITGLDRGGCISWVCHG